MSTVRFSGLRQAIEKISARVGAKDSRRITIKRQLAIGRDSSPETSSTSEEDEAARRKPAPKKAAAKRKRKAPSRKAKSPQKKVKGRKVGDDYYDSEEDSDYAPGEGAAGPSRKRPARSSRSSTSARSPAKAASSQRPWESENLVEAGDVCLPGEVWGRIFAAAAQGDVAVVLRLAKVCSRFRSIALHSPLVWRRLDISSGRLKKDAEALSSLVPFLKDRVHAKMRSLDVSWQPRLRDEGLEELLANCGAELTSVALSGSVRLWQPGGRLFQTLLRHGPRLRSLEMARLTGDALSDNGFTAALTSYLDTVFPCLETLFLNGNAVSKTQRFPLLPAVPATNLRSLDISGLKVVSQTELRVSVHELAAALPNLVSLRAMECPLVFEWDRAARPLPTSAADQTQWLALESVDVSLVAQKGLAGTVAGGAVGGPQLALVSFVGCCPRLRELRMERVGNGLSRLAGLLPPALKVLSAAHTVPGSAGYHVSVGQAAAALEALEGQLEELDLGWAKSPGLFDRLFRRPNPVLRRLNLSGASLEDGLVGRVLDHCTALEALDLTSVRGVPRGFPRRCESKQEVQKLRKMFRDQ